MTDRHEPEIGPPPDTALARRMLDAHLHLLDRQVLDVSGTPVMTVDDLELSDLGVTGTIPEGTAPPELVALLSGPVLGTRMFGGRPPSSRLQRVAWSAVYEIGSAIRLAVSGQVLDVTWGERWVRNHIIGRVPGGRHDPD